MRKLHGMKSQTAIPRFAHDEVDSCSIKFLLLTWWFTDIISIIRSSKSIFVSENFAAETENVGGFISA